MAEDERPLQQPLPDILDHAGYARRHRHDEDDNNEHQHRAVLPRLNHDQDSFKRSKHKLTKSVPDARRSKVKFS